MSFNEDDNIIVHNIEEKTAKPDYVGIVIMCPSRSTSLPADYYFSELGL
jgi:hypothetical protein